MNSIKVGKLILVFLLFSLTIKAQDTLKFSREDAEAVFLQKNLLLIAEKLNISQAEAMVLQAKLWPNPTLEVEEVNLWATPKQLGVFGEELQGFGGGNFGKNQQFGLSIEQLIITAGKRKKLIEIEKVSVDKSAQYFEDLLRNLKIEFRSQLTNLQYLQFSRNIYRNQLISIQKLTSAYQKQVEQGNATQGEYIRLKALELEISKIINEKNEELNEAQKELTLLMQLPSTTEVELTEDGFLKSSEQIRQLALIEVIETAKINRPDYKITQLEETYFTKLHAYEKSQRTPDLTLKAGYDRGGNFMYNFIGFGFSMDLPFFNRNQGNIKHAQIGLEQSRILNQQMEFNIGSEAVLSYKNLINALDFFESIEPDYESKLDTLLASYTKSFTERQISMLEYLDFLDAYLENKQIILETGKEVNEKAEELNYSVGTDLIN
ncbi:cobalt-zinc-cadmium efflux system outer membrane protein [Algoriphagus sp. 4150]|uniref:TolC family protein n=1 Tax=Algoriphagus sp. 4150 TaxID=2817756 RepID=UPI002865741C|nr:TolC family protein [Algoriphagus sp. 4150]MDR7130813.1 cobalt-zinc-cadmium efflux system outer membrane protein [Algoriphagus sp. 4150]